MDEIEDNDLYDGNAGVEMVLQERAAQIRVESGYLMRWGVGEGCVKFRYKDNTGAIFAMNLFSQEAITLANLLLCIGRDSKKYG